MNKKILLHSKVIAPAVPQWIIDHGQAKLDADAPIMNPWGSDYANRTLYHPTGEYRSSNNRVIYLDEEAHKWARENVSQEIDDIRIFASTPGRHRTGPHTDRTRNFSLIYLLHGGSSNHHTAYYRDRNSEIVEYDKHLAITDYSQVEEIARVQLPVNEWTLLNARVLHSIEFIPEGRKAIQISFNTIPSDLILRNSIYYIEND